MAERTESRIKIVLDGEDQVQVLSQGLKLMREESGLSQGEVADALDLHPSTISFLESGKRSPSLEVLEMLLSYYGYRILITKVPGEWGGSLLMTGDQDPLQREEWGGE